MANIVQKTAAITQLAEKEMDRLHERLKAIRKAVAKLKQSKSTNSSLNELTEAYKYLDQFKGGLLKADYSNPINEVEGWVTDLDSRLQDPASRNKIDSLKNEYAAAKKSFLAEANEKMKKVDTNIFNMTLQTGRADRLKKGIPGPEAEMDKVDAEGDLALSLINEFEAVLVSVKDKLKALREFIITIG